MASYDKPKLLALLERKRRAYLALNDLSDRAQDARSDVSRLKIALLSTAQSFGSPAVAERLISLPLADAQALSRADVEDYADAKGTRRPTGLNVQTWESYLSARTKLERRLAEAQELRASAESEFAIVPRLLDAVREWGFRDPSLEV